MYRFIIDKKEELLNGKTISWVAKNVGISRSYLTDVLNDKRTTTKMTAYCIVKSCNEDYEINQFFNNK